jgi:hypothetical protein
MDLLSTHVSSRRSRINMILTKARADSEGLGGKEEEGMRIASWIGNTSDG